MAQPEPAQLSAERAHKIAQECYSEVLSYCRRHAPAGYEACDLAQETFLRFVRRGAYREQGKPLAYLLTIARNVCIDAGRKAGPKTVELAFDVADESQGGDPVLAEALAQLPRELREVVELRYSADLGINEVARVLDISRFAVRRKLKRALGLLKETIEGEEDMR